MNEALILNNAYAFAAQKLREGDYSSALEGFEALGDFRDSREQAEGCRLLLEIARRAANSRQTLDETRRAEMVIQCAWPDCSVDWRLGRGGQGVVYLVHSEEWAGALSYEAVKIVDLGARGLPVCGNTAVIDRACEPVFMEQLVPHPNIVRLYDWMIVDEPDRSHSHLLLRLELLAPILCFDQLPLARVGADICDALIAMHRRGIYHMDIKPGHFFVDRDGRFKLGDLGSAVTTALRRKDIRRTIPINGKPSIFWQPPEIVDDTLDRADAAALERADIYGLGTALALLVLRENGVYIGSPSAELDAAMSRPCFDDALGRAIRRAVDQDPGARFETVADMREALAEAAQGQKPIDAQALAQRFEEMLQHNPIRPMMHWDTLNPYS